MSQLSDFMIFHFSEQEYREDNYSPVPVELSLLSRFIAEAIGYDHFTAEVGVTGFGSQPNVIFSNRSQI